LGADADAGADTDADTDAGSGFARSYAVIVVPRGAQNNKKKAPGQAPALDDSKASAYPKWIA
jgi:hypothetical protein